MNATITNNELTKSSMTFAHNLQKLYTSMGSPSTQNVRNPFPLHRLIVAMLPTHRRSGLTVSQIHTKLIEQGWIANKTTVQTVVQTMKSNNRIKSVPNKNARKDAEGRVIRGKRPHQYYFSL